MHSQYINFNRYAILIMTLLLLGTSLLPAQSKLTYKTLVVSQNAFVVKDGNTGIATDTPEVKFDVRSDTLYDKIVYFKPQIVTATQAQTINWPSGNHVLLTKNFLLDTTLEFTDPLGPTRLTLTIIHNGPGSVTFPNTIKWASGAVPTPSITQGSHDIFRFYFDGTTYYGTGAIDLQ
jgi:hypothetical protein